jgi:thiosulfate reductase cytochrome b subunit
MATHKIYLYPVWIRLWHVINALMILVLIVTGISLHFSLPDGKNLIRFDIAVVLHNIAAIVVTIGFVYYLLGNIFTKNGKFYRKWRKNLVVNLWTQFKFYAVGIFKNEKHPFPITEKQKFNPLQKFAYVIVMYFTMPLLIISGLGLMFPDYISAHIFGVDGLIFVDVLHIIVGYVISVFLIVHIYTCTLGDKPGTLFKSMINGYHEEEAHD